MRTAPYVVVTGLPASGKTTVGRALADALGLAFLDKDEILEALFGEHAEVDVELRQQLSRSSDALFRARAEQAAGAVLVSFWRHPGAEGQAGTPSDWLSALSDNLVEVHCRCPADVAEARFRGRTRHPGHRDEQRAAGLAEQLARLADKGPLQIGRLLTADTDRPVDLDALASRVREMIAR